MHQKASFTLVELLIVIGILAILTASIVLIINPAELLKKGRDATRMQDLSSLEHTLQLLETQDPSLFDGISPFSVYTSLPDSSSTCGNLGLPTLPAGYTYRCVTAENLRNADGTGWIPINFNANQQIISTPTLPIDPTNTTSSGLYYTLALGGSFELNALLESATYRSLTTSDGGDSFAIYERGTDTDLLPYSDTGLIGYWTFDEGSGSTAQDSSGNGNEGTLTGDGLIWESSSKCKIGGCLYLSGTSDYVTILDSGTIFDFDASQSFTLMGWAMDENDTGSNTWANIVTKGNQRSGYCFTGHGPGYAMGRAGSSQRLSFGIIDGTACKNKYELSGEATEFRFASLVVDRSAQILQGYINAIPYEAGTDISAVGSLDSASEDLQIGYGNSTWLGKLDDIRIYNRALSAAEIQAIYNATK